VRCESALDAIVVVAGGMTDDGRLPQWVTPRLDYAAEAWRRENGEVKILLSGSMTPHKPPPMARGGFNLHESTSMAEYLMEKHNIPGDALLKDTASMDTIGNAYYSLCLHATPLAWRDVEIVTSAFHMARTRAAFEWVWGLSPLEINMKFVSTEDAGITREALDARALREAESAAALRDNASRVTTLSAFNEWLYTTHKCYAVLRQHEIGDFSEMLNDPALKSY
jgi:uncharacterized SAM-binding protein YcdF (DUF218 family)